MYVRRSRESLLTDAHLRRTSAWRHLTELIAARQRIATNAANVIAVQRLRALGKSLWHNRNGKRPGVVDRRFGGVTYRVPEPPSWPLIRHFLSGASGMELEILSGQTRADLRFVENGIAFFADRVAEDLLAALAAATPA